MTQKCYLSKIVTPFYKRLLALWITREDKKMQYIEVLNDLKKSINEKGLRDLFLKSVISLKHDFGKEVSTKFLKDLCEVDNTRKKTYRISYLLRTNKLKTEKRLRFFQGWILNKYQINITEYKRDKKGKVFVKDIKSQDIGNLFIRNQKEVLHFVKI